MSKAVAFVLLSGGIDSTTCLHIACGEFDDVRAISIDYGQRHKKEITFAKRQAAIVGATHKTLNLKAIVPKTMLTDKDAKVPHTSYGKIKGVSPTYVPFRNGLMLSCLTSYVHGTLINERLDKTGFEHGIYFGAHAEDAQNWAYPDCTPEFIGAMSNAIFIGSYQRIRLHTPLQWLGKRQIVELGTSLGIDWGYTWSCYKGEKLHCGKCPTCLARKKGFKDAHIIDPTPYAGKS